MAQFGVPATQMSGPDTKGAKFVAQPVADQSGGILAGAAAGLAADAYKGYSLASLENAQEKVIDEYISSKQNPDIVREAEADIGGLDKASESLWKRVASDAEYQPDVSDFSGVEKSLNERIEKLKAAKEQGVMSPQEFSDRILATTREAVAKNPGLYAELKQHSARVLELSGITDILKADVEAAKSQQKQVEDFQKYYMELAKTHNVPLVIGDGGQVDWDRLKKEVDKIQYQKQLVTSSENFNKLESESDKNTARIFMKNNGYFLVNGKVNEVLSKGALLIGQGGDYQGAITQTRLAMNSALQQYTQSLGTIANDPAVKEALSYMQKQGEFVISTLEKAGSKEDALKISDNLVKMLRNDQFREVSKHLNPEQLEITTKILNTVGGARVLEKNPQLMDDMVNTFGDLLAGVSGSPRVDYKASVNGKNAVSEVVSSLAKETLLDPNNAKHLEKTINTIATDVQNPDKFKTPEEKFTFYEGIIKSLGDPVIHKAFAKVNPGVVGKAAEMLDDYMNMTTPAMNTSILKWEKQGVAVTMDVLPDGRVLFKANNPQAAQDLNSRYTSRINDSLSALANLMGIDTKSAAVEQFYPKYLPAWADDPDLVPVEIRTVKDADKALKAGKISKQEYEGILNEMSQ